MSLVKLAEAAAMAVWGSARSCIDRPPLAITEDHMHALAQLGLESIQMYELPMGSICHCMSATLAVLSSDERCAHMMVHNEHNAILKSVLALTDVAAQVRD